MRNGINIASISELVQEIRDNPAEARYAYSVSLRYHGGSLARGSINAIEVGTTTAGRNFACDIELGAASAAQAPADARRPEELFVAGLGGCVMLTAVMGFTTRKVSLSDVRIDVNASFGSEPRVAYSISADTDGSAAQSGEIIELVTSYSPNHRTVVEPGVIALSVTHRETGSATGPDPTGAGATSSASVALKARCQWDRALQLAVDTDLHGSNTSAAMLVDAPKQIGGIDLGPNPQEYLLLGLGAAILREVLAAEPAYAGSRIDMQLGGVVDLRGIMGIDAAVPVRVQELSCAVRVEGPGTEQAVQDAFHRALERAPLARLISEPNSVAVSMPEARPC